MNIAEQKYHELKVNERYIFYFKDTQVALFAKLILKCYYLTSLENVSIPALVIEQLSLLGNYDRMMELRYNTQTLTYDAMDGKFYVYKLNINGLPTDINMLIQSFL